jgi:hypothetical protein
VRARIICVLILSIAFVAVMIVAMAFGRSFYIDDDYGGAFSPDLISIAVSVVLSLLAAAGLWLADVQQRNLPLLTLPLSVVIAFGIGYESTDLALRYASSRYAILTDDCYYANALAYRDTTGIFVLSGGRTAFHPLRKVRSMHFISAEI